MTHKLFMEFESVIVLSSIRKHIRRWAKEKEKKKNTFANA